MSTRWSLMFLCAFILPQVYSAFNPMLPLAELRLVALVCGAVGGAVGGAVLLLWYEKP